MGMQFGTYAFWFMTACAVFTVVTILLKTKWWMTSMGRNLLWISLTFLVAAMIIMSVQLKLLSPELTAWVRFVIFSGCGIGLLWMGINVWVHSKTWAWKRSE